MSEIRTKLIVYTLASVLSNEEATCAYILDVYGKVLTDGTDDNPQRGITLEGRLIDQILGQESWITENADASVKVGGPVLLTEGHVLGYVNFDFPLPC